MIQGYVDSTGFDVFVDELAKGLRGSDRKKLIRTLAFKFIETVIPKTPVDTGRARAGWLAASGRLAGAKGLLTGLERTGSDHGMQAIGAKEGSFRESGTKTDKYGIEITNGVPYIEFLELGSSQQAPSGFVRLALREMMGKDGRAEIRRATEAELRLANIKARAAVSLRQGIGPRTVSGGRLNLGRR